LWEKLQGWWLLVIVRFLGLGRPRSIRPASDTFHKILCIGDGSVEGWGDVWRFGRHTAGYPARLQDLIDETDMVRQHWAVINRGHYGSTTDDWLPDANSKPSVGARWVKRTLWRDVMDDPNVNDAEIVLVSLGAMDNQYGTDAKSASHSVKNLIAICRALKSMHKVVFVSPIPAGREEDRGHKRRNLERNLLLWEFLQKQQALVVDSSQEKLGVIYPGPGWNGRHGKDMYATDLLHFNSQGYQMRAEEWGNELLQPMLRIEWQCWQKLVKNERASTTSTSTSAAPSSSNTLRRR
jgi:lysophospholipase L1-like esterase